MIRPFFPLARTLLTATRCGFVVAWAVPAAVFAAPVHFHLESQAADAALMAFARQADAEVLFSFDALHRVASNEVEGTYEPEEALDRLLKGTGFSAERNASGRFVVARNAEPIGGIRGRILGPDGHPVQGARIFFSPGGGVVTTDSEGRFELKSLPPGPCRLFAAYSGYQTLEVDDVAVLAGRLVTLDTLYLEVASNPALLKPFIVEAHSEPSALLDNPAAPPAPRSAIGDLDQPRSEDDALAYRVFDKQEILQSGVISINQFLEQHLLDSDAQTLAPDQNSNTKSFVSGSTNLGMRGYLADATIVLTDGRRLPEIVTALPDPTLGPLPPQPDVDIIPISMIDRIEVLPASASAIYSGSPEGGVINIILRPDINATEITTTYKNAVAHYDAPESTTSFVHGQSLLGGALRVRFDATFTQVRPPTESDLGYIRANVLAKLTAPNELYRATPNVTSADGTSLFGPGTPTFTSVAPGADGTGGLASFADRQGVQSLALFQPPGGGLADSPTSIDYPYGRKTQTQSVFGSATYDATPWLQFGIEGSAGRTVNTTGFSVFSGNLNLPANSVFNPFGQPVNVTLNETAPRLGEDFNQATIDFYEGLAGLLLRLRGGWQISADAQYSRSLTHYRGIAGFDPTHWQDLVDEGTYNPLRDTQRFGPPDEFYSDVIEFYGPEGSTQTLGDYSTVDSSVRLTNPSFALPTGNSEIILGGDYRFEGIAKYVDDLYYGDGSRVGPPVIWGSRTLQRISTFGEFQVPLVPVQWLPDWVHGVDSDLSARYTFSTLANESNLAPTAALKVDLAGGFSLRGSFATANRFPTPILSRPESTGGGSGSGIVDTIQVYDPVLRETESVLASSAVDPSLLPEASVTQTAGILFERGSVHRFRVSVDIVDTVTSAELEFLNPQSVVDLEGLFPQRVVRAPALAGQSGLGPISEVFTGDVNLAWRHSYEWNTAFDYAWTQCMGGTLEAYCRWNYFSRYEIELLPSTPPVDELRAPDGQTPGLLKHRLNFGANWSNRTYGFGLDGHYFHSRILPEIEWAAQGSDQVAPYWQFDGFTQCELSQWLPWKSAHYGVRGQLRVDNLFGALAPKYADAPSGAGVQPYGDWRGRTYALSVTISF